MRKHYEDLPYYKLTEKCLYEKKRLPGKIQMLQSLLEDMQPQTTQTVIKLNQGSTKTLFDTSITERWGIRRADSEEAAELFAKCKLLEHLDFIINKVLTSHEALLVNCKYDREMKAREAQKEMHISRATYFRLKKVVVNKVWGYLRLIEPCLSRATK